MSDILTKEQRYKCMSHIRSKDTKPEIVVRKCLYAAGYRYRLQVKDLPGRPDIVFRRLRTVVFINGCFWHGHEGCRYFRMPKTNIAFWESKISKKKERDSRNKKKLKALGWNVIDIWECQLKPKKLPGTIDSLLLVLNRILVEQVERAETVSQAKRHLPNYGYGDAEEDIAIAAESEENADL